MSNVSNAPFRMAAVSLMPEPAANHGRVDAAEIGGVDQVVAFVELRQAGNLAVLAALDLLPATNIRFAAP